MFLEFLCVAARNVSPNQYVAYEFVVRDKDLRITNLEPEKCSELVWSSIHDLPADLIPDFHQVIARCLVGEEKYLELGW